MSNTPNLTRFWLLAGRLEGCLRRIYSIWVYWTTFRLSRTIGALTWLLCSPQRELRLRWHQDLFAKKKQSEVSKSFASRNIHKRQWGLKLRTCDIHLSNMAIHWTENYSNFFYFCHNLKVDNISITLSLLFFIYTFHKFYKTTERNLFQSMSTQSPILTEALTARGDFWNECLKNRNSKSSHSGWSKHRLTARLRLSSHRA